MLFSSGFVFEDFKEGIIKFPPTHKFIIGANKYAKNRIPSYTVFLLSPFLHDSRIFLIYRIGCSIGVKLAVR